MTTMTRKQAAAESTGNFADHAAQSASQAIRSTQDVTNAAFDRMNDRVESARDRAAPLLDRWSAQAEEAAQRNAQRLRETSAQLRERAHLAVDATGNRIKEDPLKSMLIAAAFGAALMGLLGLLRRRDTY